MALSKATFLTYLRTLTKPYLLPRRPPSTFLPLRPLSFATPEEAAAERRRRKRKLRIEPPLSSNRHNQSQPNRRSPPQSQSQSPISNPNSPKLPEHVSALTGKRLDLHNRILTLIRDNDLKEADLLTRHSIYSNCKPTIFTCNAVMTAQLRQSKYSDLLALHRFVTQASVAPNVITHNLIIQAYCDCRKLDTALEHYKQLIDNAPFNPSPTTYRILIKGLVDDGKLERAMELKDEMIEKGLAHDPIVYGHLMAGIVKNEDDGNQISLDKVFALYDEVKEKVGSQHVSDGVVYGSLMKAYFKKGMETEAMHFYNEALESVCGLNSTSFLTSKRAACVTYNSVLDALFKNGKYDEALELFNGMMEAHNPPTRLTVNIGSFNVMVEGFVKQRKFKEASEVFRKIGEKKCRADIISVNNLIEKLCENGMVSEAEEIYQDMVGLEKEGPNADELTYVLLVDACFGQNRADDAVGYFEKMVDPSSGLKPNAVPYNRVINALINAGKIDEAKGIFDRMAVRFKLEAADYEVMLKALCEAGGKLEEVLKLVDVILEDENFGALNSVMNELVLDELRKEGREDELERIVEEKKKKKEAEALAKKEAEEKATAATGEITNRIGRRPSGILPPFLAAPAGATTENAKESDGKSISEASTANGTLNETITGVESNSGTPLLQQETGEVAAPADDVEEATIVDDSAEKVTAGDVSST